MDLSHILAATAGSSGGGALLQLAPASALPCAIPSPPASAKRAQAEVQAFIDDGRRRRTTARRRCNRRIRSSR